MHCCEGMKFFIEEQKIALGYNLVLREYYINLKYVDAVQLIKYCPWCSSKLPESLEESYFLILKNEYGIEFPYTEDADRVPEEFKTDEWWKKRGL